MGTKDTLDRTEVMRQHIESCRASDMTVLAYCKANNLAPSKYYYWQKRLQPKTAVPSFKQISPMSLDTMSTVIDFPNGIRISFSGFVNTSILKELACCI